MLVTAIWQKAEIAQQSAAPKVMGATSYANALPNEAYREASDVADLLSGLYAKESKIIKKIRKIRK